MTALAVRSTESGAELRPKAGTPFGYAVGYAAVFGKPSAVLPGNVVETVMPGAFTESLRSDDVFATHNHNMSQYLGRVSNGTLRLGEDRRGVPYAVALPETDAGRDVAEMLKRGDITGSSFAFQVVEDVWSAGPGGVQLRALKSARLRDVGPTLMPSYADSTAAHSYELTESGDLRPRELAARSVAVSERVELRSWAPYVAVHRSHIGTREMVRTHHTGDLDDARQFTLAALAAVDAAGRGHRSERSVDSEKLSISRLLVDLPAGDWVDLPDGSAVKILHITPTETRSTQGARVDPEGIWAWQSPSV